MEKIIKKWETILKHDLDKDIVYDRKVLIEILIDFKTASKIIYIPDVMAILPSDKEIEAEASSYDNSMSSMAESVWMPTGVKAGVKWVKDYMLKKVTNNYP